MKFHTEPHSRLAAAQVYMGSWEEPGHQDYGGPIFDGDSRRWLYITVKKGRDFLDGIAGEFRDLPRPVLAAIRAELDVVSPNVTKLVLNLDGEVLCRSIDPHHDPTRGTYYAPVSDYQIPAHIKMLARDELVEVTRLIAFVDIVTPVSSSSLEQERLVFKYYQEVFDVRANWNAIHIGAKLSTHPHICPVRHVIVDEIDRSRVVGFTAPFIPGGDIYETRASRPFKLKWVKQLFQTLDDLHLKYGVYHGDVSPTNMVVDPSTDNLVLIDFGCSGKIGTPVWHWHHRAALCPEVPHNPLYDSQEHQPLWAIAFDIQKALLTVWSLITGATGNVLTDPEAVDGRIIVDNATMREGGWVRHPDVKLDSPVEDYYKVTMDWLRERNTGLRITEHHQASEPLNYPDYMPPPQVDIDAHMKKRAKEQAAKEAQDAKRHAKEQAEVGNMASQQGGKLASDPVPLEDMRFRLYVDSFMGWYWLRDVQGDRGATSGRDFLRLDAIEAGCPFFNWERPPTAQLDHSRRLLASGKYEDESTSATSVDITTNKRKRKHSVEVESRDDGDNNGGNADDSNETTSGGNNTDVTTKRITRSASKQANTATPSAPNPTRKVAAPKPTRKAAPPKRAGKAAAPKPTRKAAPPMRAGKAAAPKPTRKAAAPKRAGKAAASKPTRKAAASKPTRKAKSQD